MPVKIVYDSNRRPTGIDPKDDLAFVLTKDNWNDFGIRTLFGAFLVSRTQKVRIGSVKLMVDEEHDTSSILEKAPEEEIGGHLFAISGQPYLSLGTDLEYYEKIREHLPDDWRVVLEILHDTVFLEHEDPYNDSLRLRRTYAFRKSLLRDSSATKAFGSARQLLFAEQLKPDRFNFTMRYKPPRVKQPIEVAYRFDPDPEFALPHNVDVLIGKNGLGKTLALYYLVDYLLQERQGHPERIEKLSFESLEPVPQFRHIIAVSFSPFETFPLRRGPELTTEAPATGPLGPTTSSPRYTYCGFRNPSGGGGQDYAWLRAWQSLVDILTHDEHLVAGLERPKFASLMRVLNEGLDFSSILVELKPETEVPDHLEEYVASSKDRRFFLVSKAERNDREGTISLIRDGSVPGTIRFAKKGQLIAFFSAGQAMFIFMVFGVIAEVVRESLILIDEPELYLHPNLEIAYLRMLRTLLEMFESFAIIATHSLFVARETPARNVRVFTEGDRQRVVVTQPSVETFGADITNIANLVFDNIMVEKPYEQWLRDLIGEERDYNKLKARFERYLNFESMTFLRNALEDKIEEDADGVADEEA